MVSQLASLGGVCYLVLQDNAAIFAGNGTVFRDNVASYGGGIGEAVLLWFACLAVMACCHSPQVITALLYST